ncbi:DUF1553 domain-containing protein [Stieleria sp.]|uniref:DUF1553 domain-containing protein n=1 Tax=Stieleria sp. TaxID=2795976 RepID=UPI003567D61F
MLKRSPLWFILCLTLVWRSVAIADDRAANLYESAVAATPNGEIDRIVFAELSSLGIQPVTCSDAVFVRRAYLDIIGTLPTADEALQFIEDPDVKTKRAALIERLLDRPEFADYWSMKWGDVLRIKAEFPINLWPNAAQAYHRWVRASIVENKRYDQFARELLTSSGSNFRVGSVNFYRAMQNKTAEGIASSVALTFMGTRTESWPEERLSGMAVFFSQVGYKPTAEWKEEIVFWDPLDASTLPDNAAPGQAAVAASLPSSQAADDTPESITKPAKAEKRSAAVFPDGTKASLSPDRDPREVFADWLITPENPWFTRSIANRVWAWLMGRGIVHEPDDIREDNPPSNPELMAFLEQELIASDYDLKHLYRLILNSATYQMSSMPVADRSEAPWARYPLRRLDAEVLIDAVNQITGTVDLYTSPIPEPFTYIPSDQPAIALADGSITSPFLALFGRSARATGMENERNNRPVASQWLHLLNSGHIQTKLERGPALKAVLTSSRDPAVIAERLYLTILSRRPTDAELKTVASYVRSTPLKRNEAAIDVAWALINSPEFLYRH